MSENPGPAVEDAVRRALVLVDTWLHWDGLPRLSEDGDRIYTPHKAVRRIADHLVDHLAEVEALLAGVATQPDAGTPACSPSSRTGPGSPRPTATRPTNGCRGWPAPSRCGLPPPGRTSGTGREGHWTLREIADHLTGVLWYAEQVGDLSHGTGSPRPPARPPRLSRMKVSMATSPGHGRPNEDFVGAVPGAVVLLDGAGIPGMESVCSHGVAGTHTPSARLFSGGCPANQADLVAALADGIEEVAGQHRHTCDIASSISPQATVAIIRYDEVRLDFPARRRLRRPGLRRDRTASAHRPARGRRASEILTGPGRPQRRNAGVRTGAAIVDRGVSGTTQPARRVLDRQGRP